MQQALDYANDKNRREPVENGAANLDILINRAYEILYKYRLHEVSPCIGSND